MDIQVDAYGRESAAGVCEREARARGVSLDATLVVTLHGLNARRGKRGPAAWVDARMGVWMVCVVAHGGGAPVGC
eukprot:102190-Chlamydomonas_euryale.AAC.1